MCKSVEDYAKRERHVERINAIKNMMEWGVSEDRIFGKYSKEEYHVAIKELAEESAALS